MKQKLAILLQMHLNRHTKNPNFYSNIILFSSTTMVRKSLSWNTILLTISNWSIPVSPRIDQYKIIRRNHLWDHENLLPLLSRKNWSKRYQIYYRFGPYSKKIMLQSGHVDWKIFFSPTSTWILTPNQLHIIPRNFNMSILFEEKEKTS